MGAPPGQEEGIFCGGSSGTALAAAMRYAQDLPSDRLVVVILLIRAHATCPSSTTISG